jgi:hypothetical protein
MSKDLPRHPTLPTLTFRGGVDAGSQPLVHILRRTGSALSLLERAPIDEMLLLTRAFGAHYQESSLGGRNRPDRHY